MAGIGFELRKLLKRDNLTGVLQAYLFAAVISSGPWVLSIVGMALIGALNLTIKSPLPYILEFQVTISYTIVTSLCLTGILQLAFTRYVSDRLFLEKTEEVVPLFHGALLLVTIAAGSLGTAAAAFLFPEESVIYKVLLVAGLVIMSDIWIGIIMLSGLRQYLAIVWLFFVGYGISALAAISLRGLGVEGLLFGFFLGQLVLLVGTVALTVRNFPADRFISLAFLVDGRVFKSLVFTGLFYNLAVWVDKVLFWHFLPTSIAVIGPLRASPVYDFPIFLAHLSIIPGMAVFLMKMETDFVEQYERFYDTVREGGTLERIELLRNEMSRSVRSGIYELVKIQSLAGLALVVSAPAIFAAIGVSELSLPVLYVCVVAASVQTVLMGVMNVLFYFDRRKAALSLTTLLMVLNAGATAATLAAGPRYYGMGYAIAMLVTCTVGFFVLDRKLERLEYETFMLQ